jgi:membrane protein
VFGQLQDALNTVWGVKAKPGGGNWAFLRSRFFSFAMVGRVCFLLLVSLTIESVLKAFSHYIQLIMPGGIVIAMREISARKVANDRQRSAIALAETVVMQPI